MQLRLSCPCPAVLLALSTPVGPRAKRHQRWKPGTGLSIGIQGGRLRRSWRTGPLPLHPIPKVQEGRKSFPPRCVLTGVKLSPDRCRPGLGSPEHLHWYPETTSAGRWSRTPPAFDHTPSSWLTRPPTHWVLLRLSQGLKGLRQKRELSDDLINQSPISPITWPLSPALHGPAALRPGPLLEEQPQRREVQVERHGIQLTLAKPCGNWSTAKAVGRWAVGWHEKPTKPDRARKLCGVRPLFYSSSAQTTPSILPKCRAAPPPTSPWLRFAQATLREPHLPHRGAERLQRGGGLGLAAAQAADHEALELLEGRAWIAGSGPGQV